MRLFVLVLNILVGSSLLAQSTEIFASSVHGKTNKNSQQRGHATHLRGKNKSPKPLRSKNPGDVWERIRSGMQIPRPSSAQAQPNQSLATNNSLSKSSVIQTRIGLRSNLINSSDTSINPVSHHYARARSERIGALQKSRSPMTASEHMYNRTPYGRLKLSNTVSSRVRKNAALHKHLFVSKNGNMNGIAAEQTRRRTHINSLPKLHRLNSKIPTASLIDSSSTLKKLFKINNLAKSAFTPYSSAFTEQGLAGLMPHRISAVIKYERVNKHIVWYTQHRAYLHQVAERARPYLYHIVDSLSKHKLPHELALLPIVESAYQPTALSPKSAAGLWQFIPSTAHDFDLHQSDHYDARLDIAASTQAAIRYLSFLKQHFNGDWLLALAAYNCGLGVVDDAINRNIAKGLNTDYWSLRLPEETQEYVPRFLALSSIFANPAAHGLKLAPVRNEPYFVKVKIDRKNDIEYLVEKDFKEVAQLANLNYEQFRRLNPGYLNPKLTGDGPFTFLMPSTNANQLHQRLASIAQFLNESTAITIRAPLKKKTSPTVDEHKTALSLLTDLTLTNGADLVTVSNPFLSLNLNTSQTTPRIVIQSVIPPVDLNPDPERINKNI